MTELPTLDPSTTALMVMDYQPGILGRLDDADAQVGRAADALAAARAAGTHVGYVRVAMTATERAAIPEYAAMAAIAQAGDAFDPDAPGTQVHEDLAPHDGDIVVRKIRWGAFSTTDLGRQLDARDVDTLVLAGISTSGVVLSTVREAADRDLRVVVLSDGCADPEPDVHEFLVSRVFPRQAAIAAVNDVPQMCS